MDAIKLKTTIGCNDIGFFIGDGDFRLQFTEDEMNALIFANGYSHSFVSLLTDCLSATLASGEIPSCFKQDMTKEEAQELGKDLTNFSKHFSDAFFQLMLAFDF